MRKPFVPVKFILDCRTTYDSTGPEMMLVFKSAITVAIYDRGQQRSADEIRVRETLVSFLHVAATDDLPLGAKSVG